MENVEVHSKAFVIRWVEAPIGASLHWRITPQKKSINFGVYSHEGNKPAVGFESGGANNIPMNRRLEKNSFKSIAALEKVAGNECKEGSYTIEPNRAGMVAFVFDNTFSISTAKTINFSFTLLTGNEKDPNVMRRGSVATIDTDAPSSVTLTSDGRYLTGTLLKKRRKRLQGYARRHFSLDLRLGLLSYYLHQKSSSLRGVMPLKISDITLNRYTREITVDSGVERWQLRAQTQADYESWVTAFEDARASTVGHLLNRQASYAEGSIASGHLRSTSTLNHKRAPSVPHGYGSLENHNDWVNAASYTTKLSNALAQFRQSGAAHEGPGFEFAGTVDLFLEEINSLLGNHKDEGGPIPAEVVHEDDDEFFDAQDTFNDYESDYSDYSGSEDEDPLYPTKSRRASSISFQHARNVVGIRAGERVAVPESAIVDSSAQTETDVASTPYANGVVTSAPTTRTPSRPSVLHESIVEEDEDEEKTSTVAEPKAPAPAPKAPEPPKEPEIPALSPLPHAGVKRRSDVPKSKFSPPSLISMLRQSAGKDLSSITAPVTSNEPMTALQKLAEIYEYSEILDAVVAEPDAKERTLLVALFAISQLSSMRIKERSIRKPFNPLLGETFELVREDKGFRFIAEKVSHRPPVFATVAESAKWTLHFTSRPHQRIWGKSAELNDTGRLRLVLHETNETFEYMFPNCFLRNLIAGEKYVEPAGNITVDSSAGHIAVVEFKSGGMFSGRSEELKIFLQDEPTRLYEGKWTEGMWQVKSGKRAEQVWKVGSALHDSKEKWGWTPFAATLNEITDLEHGKLPPVDSRFREDQRLYEQQEDVERAEEIKLAYEKKQRERRKVYEDENKTWEPVFFKSKSDAQGVFQLRSGSANYWNRRARGDWNGVIDVFEL